MREWFKPDRGTGVSPAPRSGGPCLFILYPRTFIGIQAIQDRQRPPHIAGCRQRPKMIFRIPDRERLGAQFFLDRLRASGILNRSTAVLG